MSFMFCPKCATENAGDSKFCRGCGAGLEVVALALSGKLAPIDSTVPDLRAAITPAEILQKYDKSIRHTIVGGLMLTFSLISLVVPMFFITSRLGWLAIWGFSIGWMAAWGITALGNGLGGLATYRAMKQREETERLRALEYRPLLSTGKGEMTTRDLAEVSPPSVTEPTTRRLMNR
jgi:hypothetical protein